MMLFYQLAYLFLLILFICHFCTLQEVSVSIMYEKCILLNYLRDRYIYIYKIIFQKNEETVSGMMFSLIWKMMFQKWALDISYLSQFSMTLYMMLQYDKWYFLEKTAQQAQPCVKAKLYCLRFLITKGCAITEFKCFSSPHRDVKQQKAGASICSVVVAPLKIYMTTFSNTLCLANKNQQTSSSRSICQVILFVLQAPPREDYFNMIFNMIDYSAHDLCIFYNKQSDC